MKITRISIPATWNDKYGISRDGHAEFRLGAGPCGKFVMELHLAEDTSSGVKLSQVCSDGTTQTFFYPTATLTGRVQVDAE